MTKQFASTKDLPRKFTFTYYSNEYTVDVDSEGNTTITNADGMTPNKNDDRLLTNINSGMWKFKEELEPAVAPNGVDADGNPKTFTRADLKTLMRVVLADGRKAIISETGFGDRYGACVVYDTECQPYGAFDPAQINGEFYPDVESLNIVEVYANPGHGNMFKQSARGDLIWKSDSAQQRARREADEAIVAATEALKAAEAQFASAKAARAAL